MRVFQHLDSWKKADGIGEDVFGLAQVFSKLKIESFIVTRINLETLITTNIKTINLTEIPKPQEHDLHILHYGGAGYPLEFFLSLPGKKILRFHNYTPSYFFKSEIDAELALRMRDLQVRTEIELKSLSIYCESSWCDSTFNAEVLQEFGFKEIKVLPICKQFKIVSSKVNNNTKLHLGFVSRFAPQKKWESIIDVFQFWNKLHPESYLDCIGTRVPAFDKYFNFIVEEVKSKKLENRVRFHFQITESEMESITETWFASLCLSEHEGFGLPILESFGSGILTLVNQTGATKETAGEAGILIHEMDPLKITFLLEYFLENPEIYAKVIQRQKDRVKYHNSFDFQSFVEREFAFEVL